MNKPQTPIGVFDSGVGGLTVVRALRDALPDADIVYLGDTARVPYGIKSPRTVERYSLACLRFLLAREVNLVMIACNTASANALSTLMAASPVPVIGAVDPGAASAVAASPSRRIGVIGTLATIASRAYERAIEALAPDARVTTLACPLLVPLAEEGWVHGDIAERVAERYLTELFARDRDIDTLVLGCTHYPLLRDVLAEVATRLLGRPLAVVDSATAMARAAREALAPRDGTDAASAAQRPGAPTRGGALACFATDTSRLGELAPRFLGATPTTFELVDL